MTIVQLEQIRSDLVARGATIRRHDELYKGPYAPLQSGQDSDQWSQYKRAVSTGLRKLLRHLEVNPTKTNVELAARGVELISAMKSIHCEELKRDAAEWLRKTEQLLGQTQTLTKKKSIMPSPNAIAALGVRWASQTVEDDNSDVQAVLAAAFAMGFEAGERYAAAACSPAGRNLTEAEVLEPLRDWEEWQGLIQKAQALPAGIQIATLTKTFEEANNYE